MVLLSKVTSKLRVRSLFMLVRKVVNYESYESITFGKNDSL